MREWAWWRRQKSQPPFQNTRLPDALNCLVGALGSLKEWFHLENAVEPTQRETREKVYANQQSRSSQPEPSKIKINPITKFLTTSLKNHLQSQGITWGSKPTLSLSHKGRKARLAQQFLKIKRGMIVFYSGQLICRKQYVEERKWYNGNSGNGDPTGIRWESRDKRSCSGSPVRQVTCSQWERKYTRLRKPRALCTPAPSIFD